MARLQNDKLWMLIHKPLKYKIDPYGPKPLKVSKDGTLREFNAQTKIPKMHAPTLKIRLMQIGHLNGSK